MRIALLLMLKVVTFVMWIPNLLWKLLWTTFYLLLFFPSLSISHHAGQPSGITHCLNLVKAWICLFCQ